MDTSHRLVSTSNHTGKPGKIETMTRKDYELVAASIKTVVDVTYDDKAKITLREVAMQIAYGLTRTNERFDRNRFLKACGID
jgi:hypothetical protein